VECEHEWYAQKFGEVITVTRPHVDYSVASDDAPAWAVGKIKRTEWVYVRCCKCGEGKWVKVESTRDLCVGSRVYDEEII